MTLANHILMGSIIGAVVKTPALALPLAVVSHYALDALPHFGFKNWDERKEHQTLLKTIVIIDAIIAVGVVIYLRQLAAGWLIFACSFAAVSPDLAWVYWFTVPERFGTRAPTRGSWINRMHSQIQKYEFRQGFVLEWAVVIILGAVVTSLLR